MNSKMAICLLCAAAIVAPVFSRADDAAPATPSTSPPPAESTAPVDYKRLYEQQKQRNDDLEKRVGLLEQHSTQDLYVAKADLPENTVKFLKEVDISGFVSASYNYNFNQPADNLNAGQGYENNANQFMLNKFTLIAQKAVDFDAFAWKAGFFTEVILGQDAAFTQARGLSLGDNGDLEQAYVQANVPVGNGVKVIFGKYVTPLGYELVENELNPNWTMGYQWTLFEPFTHTGLQLDYKINNEWEVDFYFNNGWDVVTDNNHSFSYIGRLYYTPNDNTSYTLIGYGGPEQTAVNVDPTDGVPGADGHWREGVELVVTSKCTPKLGTAIQVDYGHETAASVDHPGGDAQWWGIGGWLTYDFSEKLQAAFRTDYVNDLNGARSSDSPSTAPFPVNGGQEIVSVTLTLNYKPIEGLRLAPEIRFDRSTLDNGFDGRDTQVLGSVGAVYSF
jgi:hypothetical protein